MIKPEYILTALILPLLCISPVNAEEASSSITDIKELSDTVLTDESAQDMFEKAMAERDRGKIYNAIEKFEDILSRRPSLNRARLELAVSYHRANNFDAALREFQTVLDNPDTPEKVRLAILAYLGQLSSDELKPKSEHSFSYYTKVGLLFNSNINFAPLRGSKDFDIPDGEDTSSPGLDTFLSASHRYKDNKPFNAGGAATHFEWQSQISWTGNNYTQTNDFNLNIISASTGPAFISPGRWRGAINLQVDQTYFGGSELGTFISLNPLVTFDLGNYRGITLEASVTDNNFSRSEDAGRDGSSVLLGGAYSTLLNGVDNGIEAGFRLRDQTADDDQFGFDNSEIYFGGFMAYDANSNFYLNLSFLQYDFDGATDTGGGTSKVRDEIESHYQIGYNRDLSSGYLQGWTLNTNLEFTKNNSNIDAFSYERTLLSINLTRYFI